MKTKTRNLLFLLLSAMLTVTLAVGCDDDDGEDVGDTAADTSGDTGGTDTNTGDTDETDADDTDEPNDVDDDATDVDDDATDADDTDEPNDVDDDATDTNADDTDEPNDVEDDTTDVDDDMVDMEEDMVMAGASVTADDITLDDLSTRVTVTEVVSEGDGWIVIHEDDGGAPGPVIGHAAVVDGTNADVLVELERPAADGETLHAMLHIENPADGVYTFDGMNGEDPPAMAPNDAIIMDPFVVTVPTDLPAIRVLVSATSSTDYTFDGAEPAFFEDVVFPNGTGDDVEIQLENGLRYEFVNSASGGHPFEFITETGAPAADVVLLSEDAAGTLEGDPNINWVDDGAGTFQFTVAGAFIANAYRCSIHTANMRGPVSYLTP